MADAFGNKHKLVFHLWQVKTVTKDRLIGMTNPGTL